VTHPPNPIGAILVALLAVLALLGCGDDDSGDDQRSAAEILRALPSGYEYKPVTEAQEDQVIRQSMPEEAAAEIDDVEMRRVLRSGEVTGFAMAVVSGASWTRTTSSAATPRASEASPRRSSSTARTAVSPASRASRSSSMCRTPRWSW
jgi:hypothetical protein